MKSEELQKQIDSLEKQLGNPKTPQGEIKQLKDKVYSLNHSLKIAKREE